MNIHNSNVVLFPKWKIALENESKEALKEKRYNDALDNLEKLIDYDVTTHEVLTAKLICLMELGEQEQAEDLCQELLAKKNGHYYEYIHIYSTLLFQVSQYDELIELLEKEFELGEMPNPLKTQLLQVYEISKKLNLEKNKEQGSRLVEELKHAVKNHNPELQWRTLRKCRKVDVIPYIHYIEELLMDKSIHPVVKTELLDWLREQNINKEIKIKKFDQVIVINPSLLSDIYRHHSTVNILDFLDNIEQANPSLFELIKKLLYRYMYVRYPIMPSEKQLEPIVVALTFLGYQYLQLPEQNSLTETTEQIQYYIDEIISCEKAYFSVVED